MTSSGHDFTFSLRENAVDSLQHGIEHFLSPARSPRDLKATVIHVFHAVELFLKASLADVHPNLIYTKIDDGHIKDDAQTVAFKALLWRLRNFGVPLNTEQIADLQNLQSVRNSLEHHQAQRSRAQIEGYVANAIRFLDSFLPRLEVTLKELLEPKVYEELRAQIYSHDERREQAALRLAGNLPPEGLDVPLRVEILPCPDCGERFFWPHDPFAGMDQGQCYYCDAKRYVADCSRCTAPILKESPFKEPRSAWCDTCWETMMELP
ncbi:MAG TPA: hypothetical protein VF006_03335 [Longimicrobium sp.]